LLAGLHQAYGGLFDIDDVSIVGDYGHTVPRFDYGRPRPTIPRENANTFFYTKGHFSRATGRLSQFDFQPGDSDVPPPPLLDRDALFPPVSSVTTKMDTAIANEDLQRVGLRAFSYAQQATLAAGRMFLDFTTMDESDPNLLQQVEFIKWALVYAESASRSAMVLFTRRLTNEVMARRDAYLDTVPSLDPLVRKRLRTLPVHESTSLFDGQLQNLCPLWSSATPTTPVIQVPAVAPTVLQTAPRAPPNVKRVTQRAKSAPNVQTVTAQIPTAEATVSVNRSGNPPTKSGRGRKKGF